MKNPIGVYAFGTVGGIEVFDVDSYEDLVSFRYLSPNGERGRLIHSKMRFNVKGEPYFIAARQRIYLSDVVRIELDWIGMRKVA